MTTNLSRRQPMAMPWDTQDYSFDPAHFRTLFPESVVARMETHAPGQPDGTTHASTGSPPYDGRPAARRCQPFPARADLPIVVGVRMSLSFPGLIAAVPLHAVDFSSSENKDSGRRPGPGASSTRTRLPRRARGRCRGHDSSATGSPTAASAPTCRCTSSTRHSPAVPRSRSTSRPFPHERQKSADELDNSYLPDTNDAGPRPPPDRAEGGRGRCAQAVRLLDHRHRPHLGRRGRSSSCPATATASSRCSTTTRRAG